MYGILANDSRPVEFLSDSLRIQTNNSRRCPPIGRGAPAVPWLELHLPDMRRATDRGVEPAHRPSGMGPDRQEASHPSANTVHTGWWRKPDGSLPPAGDEGITIVNTRSHAAFPPSLSSGARIGNLPSQQCASYVNPELGTKIRSIGAVFGFGPGSSAGAVCLAAWDKPPPHTSGQQSEAHCHFVVTPQLWVCGVVVSSQLIELDHSHFASPMSPRPFAPNDRSSLLWTHRQHCALRRVRTDHQRRTHRHILWNDRLLGVLQKRIGRRRCPALRDMGVMSGGSP